MDENCSDWLKFNLGKTVPEFRLDIYDPVKGDFGEITLNSLRTNNKWTILFFYPADFTFV